MIENGLDSKSGNSGHAGEKMEQTRPCPNGHTMTLQKITLHFERDGFLADVYDVTAYVCPECDSHLIPGLIAEQVSETVEALFKAATQVALPDSPTPYSSLVFQRLVA
jgi:hypothetical protein